MALVPPAEADRYIYVRNADDELWERRVADSLARDDLRQELRILDAKMFPGSAFDPCNAAVCDAWENYRCWSSRQRQILWDAVAPDVY